MSVEITVPVRIIVGDEAAVPLGSFTIPGSSTDTVNLTLDVAHMQTGVAALLRAAAERMAPTVDLDMLTRAQLAERDGPAATIGDILDEWNFRLCGVTSSHHGVGLFLDLIAEHGLQISAPDAGPGPTG